MTPQKSSSKIQVFSVRKILSNFTSAWSLPTLVQRQREVKYKQSKCHKISGDPFGHFEYHRMNEFNLKSCLDTEIMMEACQTFAVRNLPAADGLAQHAARSSASMLMTIFRSHYVYRWHLNCKKKIPQQIRVWHSSDFSQSLKHDQHLMKFVDSQTTSHLHQVNSFPPGAECMRLWTGATLLQVMACRLFGAKPLPEPMMTYCQLDPKEQTSVQFKWKYKISL